MDLFIAILFNYEYPFTLFLAFLIFVIPLEKRKIAYPLYFLGWALSETYWHFRPLEDIFSYLLFFAFLLVLALLTLKNGFFESLAFVTMAFALQHLDYKLAISLAEVFWPQIVDTGLYFALYIPLFLVVNAIVFGYVLHKKRKGLSFKVNSILALALSLVVMGSTIVISYYTQEPLLTASKAVFGLVSLLSIFLCLSSLVILFINSRTLALEQDNRALEMLLEKDRQKYEFAKITAENINIHYHDLKQQIRKQGIDQGEIQEIQEQGKRQESLFYTGSRPLDVLLFEKNLICQQKKIELLFLGDGSLVLAMKPNHVYSLFGNLIDNAIEGLQDVKEERKIRVEVRKVKESVLVLVENRTLHELKTDRSGTIKTTKTEGNHGYGIKSICNIAAYYDGETLFSLENGYFRAKILFPCRRTQDLSATYREMLTDGLLR